MSPVKRGQDFFFEIVSNFNPCFVEKWSCSTSGNFTCNLSCHPGISAAVADENQSFFDCFRLCHKFAESDLSARYVENCLG